METKRCSRCEEVKSLSRFYKKSANEDGLESQCKQCHSESRTEKRKAENEYLERCFAKDPKHAYLSRPEYVEEARKEAEKKQEERRKKRREYARQYYAKHHKGKPKRKERPRRTRRRRTICREEMLENRRRWYAKHNEEMSESKLQQKREKDCERSRRWRAKNPNYHHQYRIDNAGKYRAYAANRKALSIAAEGTFTDEQFVELCNKYGNRCLCCGKDDNVKLVVDHIVPLSKGGSNDAKNIQPLCQRCNSKKHTKTTDYRNKE